MNFRAPFWSTSSEELADLVTCGTGADHCRARVVEVRPDRREAGEVPGGASPTRRRGRSQGGDLCRALSKFIESGFGV